MLGRTMSPRRRSMLKRLVLMQRWRLVLLGLHHHDKLVVGEVRPLLRRRRLYIRFKRDIYDICDLVASETAR